MAILNGGVHVIVPVACYVASFFISSLIRQAAAKVGWGVAEANAIGLVACSAGMLVLRSLSFISFRVPSRATLPALIPPGAAMALAQLAALEAIRYNALASHTLAQYCSFALLCLVDVASRGPGSAAESRLPLAMAGCLLASVGAVTFDFAAHGILPTQDGQAWRWIASYCCQAGCSALYITVGMTVSLELSSIASTLARALPGALLAGSVLRGSRVFGLGSLDIIFAATAVAGALLSAALPLLAGRSAVGAPPLPQVENGLARIGFVVLLGAATLAQKAAYVWLVRRHSASLAGLAETLGRLLLALASIIPATSGLVSHASTTLSPLGHPLAWAPASASEPVGSVLWAYRSSLVLALAGLAIAAAPLVPYGVAGCEAAGLAAGAVVTAAVPWGMWGARSRRGPAPGAAAGALLALLLFVLAALAPRQGSPATGVAPRFNSAAGFSLLSVHTLFWVAVEACVAGGGSAQLCPNGIFMRRSLGPDAGTAEAGSAQAELLLAAMVATACVVGTGIHSRGTLQQRAAKPHDALTGASDVV